MVTTRCSCLCDNPITRGYNAAHDLAAKNIFNTPGRQAAGAVVTAQVAVGSAYCAATTPVLASGLKAVVSAATTCFKAASGGYVAIALNYSAPGALGSFGAKAVAATGAMCSTAATSAALPVLSAVTLLLTTVYLGHKVVQYLRTPSVPHPHTE